MIKKTLKNKQNLIGFVLALAAENDRNTSMLRPDGAIGFLAEMTCENDAERLRHGEQIMTQSGDYPDDSKAAGSVVNSDVNDDTRTSDLAKDVAETVLEYLTKHTLGQLCMKIVMKHEGATNTPGMSTKCMQALPYKMQGTNLINWKITIPMHENMGSVAGGGV